MFSIFVFNYTSHNLLHYGSLFAVAPLAIMIAYGIVFPAQQSHQYFKGFLSSVIGFLLKVRIKFLYCILGECNCKRHQECYKGECKCKRPYKKKRKGHCVGNYKKKKTRSNKLEARRLNSSLCHTLKCPGR